MRAALYSGVAQEERFGDRSCRNNFRIECILSSVGTAGCCSRGLSGEAMKAMLADARSVPAARGNRGSRSLKTFHRQSSRKVLFSALVLLPDPDEGLAIHFIVV